MVSFCYNVACSVGLYHMIGGKFLFDHLMTGPHFLVHLSQKSCLKCVKLTNIMMPVTKVPLPQCIFFLNEADS